MVSSGLRETIRFLVEHGMVDVIVASAGGVEEDLIKCLAPTYVGDFELAGRDLRQRGLNRIGNLLVPNDNYCKFEDWIIPILDNCLDEQVNQVGFPSRIICLAHHPPILNLTAAILRTAYDAPAQGTKWTPSNLIHRLGQEIKHPDSILYWAAKVGAGFLGVLGEDPAC